MTDDDHQKLVDEVFGLVRAELANGGLDFTVLAIDQEGNRGRFEIDPRFMQSGESKNRLMEELRKAFREKGIVRYVLVAECWMDRKIPAPPAPLSDSGLQKFLSQYAEEYERRGLSPSHGGGRDEIILMHVCDRMRSTFRVWMIARNPQTGAVRDLVPFDTGADGIAGRFVNLLEGEVH